MLATHPKKKQRQRVSTDLVWLDKGRLREIRLKRGLSQKELADQIGATQREISEYETGDRRCRVERVKKMAGALECSAEDLIKKQEQQSKGDGRKRSFLDYIFHHRTEIKKRFEDYGIDSDEEAKNDKNMVGHTTINEIQPWMELERYLSDCWEFKNWFPDHPTLPRHLLRLYLCLTTQYLPYEVEEKINSIGHDGQGNQDVQEVWNYIAHTLPSDYPISHTANSLLGSFRRGRVPKSLLLLTAARLFREISIAFRNQLKLDQEWRFAQLAFEVYKLCKDNDPEGRLLNDLATGIVTSAAYSLKTEDGGELYELDPKEGLLNALREKYDRYKDMKALMALAMYNASAGKIEQAKSQLAEASRGFEGARVKIILYADSIIYCGCCASEPEERLFWFRSLLKMPDWTTKAKGDPILFSMVVIALTHPEKQWKDILVEVQERGRWIWSTHQRDSAPSLFRMFPLSTVDDLPRGSS